MMQVVESIRIAFAIDAFPASVQIKAANSESIPTPAARMTVCIAVGSQPEPFCNSSKYLSTGDRYSYAGISIPQQTHTDSKSAKFLL